MKKYLQFLLIAFALILSKPVSAQWSIDTLSQSRYTLAAASYGNFAIFAGGIGMISWPPAVSDIFFNNVGLWQASTISSPRVRLAGAGAGNKILFAGGVDDNILATYNTVDIFNTVTATWSPQIMDGRQLAAWNKFGQRNWKSNNKDQWNRSGHDQFCRKF